MAIPYMGSKRRSAGKIYQAIHNLCPDSNTLVDLFCGGFAISEYFLKQNWKVKANDKNKYIVALINKIIEGLPEDVICKFISRQEFLDIIKNRDSYEDWFVGFVLTVWTFGNNQRSYMYGREIEHLKKASHKLVVDLDFDSILNYIKIPEKLIIKLQRLDSIEKRRQGLKKVIRFLGKNKESFRLQHLERIKNLENLGSIKRLKQTKGFNLDNLLGVTCLNYDEVEIPEGAVVYCDPPYANTASYDEGSFDSAKFWDFVREKSKTNKVFVSEYSAPPDFKKVLEFVLPSLLSSGTNSNQPNECLFTI